VKAAREGSSIGVVRVDRRDDCRAAFERAAQHDSQVLCEQGVVGDETTCPLLIGAGGVARALPVIRIQAPDGNYDYKNKYFTDDTQYLCPSGLSADEEARIQSLTERAFAVLGCRGWARVDVMIRQSDRQAFLLEINTAPGMTGHSLVPMSAREAGITYEQLCLHLLYHANLDHSIATSA
jgi:D-alanine-D-alanine ligase